VSRKREQGEEAREAVKLKIRRLPHVVPYATDGLHVGPDE